MFPAINTAPVAAADAFTNSLRFIFFSIIILPSQPAEQIDFKLKKN